jgi:hypothetical protein
MSEREPRAGVPYEVADGEWATPIVAPPGQQLTPLAEVDPILGRRIVYCGPADYEWGLYAFSEQIMGRDLDPPMTGTSAAKNYVAIVSERVWLEWRFARRDAEPGEVRIVPLYACWLDPNPAGG